MTLQIEVFMSFASRNVVLAVRFDVIVVSPIACYMSPFAAGATVCSYPLKPEAEFTEDL